MSESSQFRPFGAVRGMSGLPPIADIEQTCWQVRVVPDADITPVEGPEPYDDRISYSAGFRRAND